MITFGEAITAAHAEASARQERELEQHLRTSGFSQLESFESTLCLKRRFPRVNASRFDRIVQQERSSRARRTE
jgi:hypothetical protein